MVKVFRIGSQRERPRRRWLRWLYVVLGLILPPLLYLVAYHCYQRAATAEELREALAEVDQVDPDWRFDDLQASRRVVPDEENGSRLVMAAKQLLPKPWPVLEWQRDPAAPPLLPVEKGNRDLRERILLDTSPEVPLDEKLVQELRYQLGHAQAALTEARKLADVPYGRAVIEWKLDAWSTLLPHADATQLVAHLLYCDAGLRAQDQDLEGASQSARAALNAGRSIGDDPFLVSLLIRLARVTTAVQTLERLVAQGQLGKETLKSLQQLVELDERELPSLWLMAIRGERALMHRTLNAFNTGQISFQEALGERKKESLWEAVHETWAVPTMRRWHAAYLRDMTEWVEAYRLPAAEHAQRISELETRTYGSEALFSRLMIPGTMKVAAACRRHSAYLRCAAAALAAERYRLDHGRWPLTPAQLVPAYLAEVPADPFDGKPLRLRLLGDGVIVYSVGPDGSENEGVMNREKMTEPGTDIGFRLWDVPHRRQSPP